MKNSSKYKSVSINSDGEESLSSNVQQRDIAVYSNKQGVVYFPIVAEEIGVADIEITAQSHWAADGVKKHIVFEPEGAPVSFNYPTFVDLSTNEKHFESIEFPMPKSLVEGSEKTRVKVTGDLVGPSLNNLESLLSLPTGCGEQSMAKFAPNLYVAQYLKATNQLTEYWDNKITGYLSAGYQRQLSYQRSDGGFSAFGNKDESGSTWLTAFVSRTFSEAREFIFIDDVILRKSIDWLLDRQSTNGDFTEFGKVLDPKTQGGNSGPALTAYVLLTLMQNRDVYPLKCGNDCNSANKLTNSTLKAIKRLEEQVRSTPDQFSLALMSYALRKANSNFADAAFDKLMGKAVRDGSLTHWSANATMTSSSHYIKPVPVFSRYTIWQPPRVQARPINILITSYALLSYIEADRMEDGIAALSWLTRQRNARGGFASTQDTSVALQALASFATQSVSRSTDLDIRAEGDSVGTLSFHVNQENALTLQIQEFTKSPKRVDVHVNGVGTALIEVDSSFNVNEELSTPSFDVSTVLLDDDLDSFNLMICTKWLWDRKTGMVVQEIGIPSGFKPDLSTIGTVVGMKRTERRGNTVAVYFDEIGKTSTCYSLLMTRTGKVAKSERSFVRTFDYYEPADQSTVFYQPRKLRESTICDVCDKCCSKDE